jgi:transcription-repair coupling factor (superfamily II helicase)
LSIQNIVNQYQISANVAQIITQLQKEKNHFQISNLVGSSLSFTISETFKKSEKPYLLVFNDKEEAAYYLNDLEQLLGEKNVLFYPGSYRRPYQIEETDNANILLRSEVLNRINSKQKPAIIVTYPAALFEKVVTKKELEKNTLKVTVGENLSLDFVNEILFEYKFKRVDFVTEPGDFSVRGGIIDVFSFSNDEPYRIEFFGDEIDSIRSFDVATQLSTEKLKKAAIIPNVENKTLQEHRESFLKYISSKTIIFTKNTSLLTGNLDKYFEKASEAFEDLSKEIKHAAPSELFCNGNFIKDQLQEFTLVEMSAKVETKEIREIKFNTLPQPSFNKQFNLLIENLTEYHKGGFTNYIFCANEQQAQRFRDIFDDSKQEVHYETVVFPLYQGFVDVENRLVCYTDHQIFERYHKFRLKNGYAKKQAITIQELNKLEIGDYVTHMDHGIGKFGGLQKIDVQGKKQEAIKLVYGERDILYVSIHSLHKISKFNGKDGKTPKIYKLGSGAWKKIKQKTKARVKHVAFNLIQLYAKRKLQKGFAFGPDTHIQHELEGSFIYEDTPDQFKSTQDVKNDMEKEQPMDRLVCGDVGFGKTEVAIRAAFKAVDNGKQVAILVPTTILAFQHYKTFTERLKDFPVRIDYLNRFRTAKQKTEAISGVNDGSVDIIIGTHQLTNKRLEFKNLKRKCRHSNPNCYSYS